MAYLPIILYHRIFIRWQRAWVGSDKTTVQIHPFSCFHAGTFSFKAHGFANDKALANQKIVPRRWKSQTKLNQFTHAILPIQYKLTSNQQNLRHHGDHNHQSQTNICEQLGSEHGKSLENLKEEMWSSLWEHSAQKSICIMSCTADVFCQVIKWPHTVRVHNRLNILSQVPHRNPNFCTHTYHIHA